MSAQVILFSGPPASASEVSGSYAFHDPAFARWWLESLYAIPTDLQLEVANALRTSIHSPDVQEVVDEFIGRTAGKVDIQGGADGTYAPVVNAPEENFPPGPKGVLQRAWKAAPLQTALGVAGVIVMLLSGLWTLVKAF